MTSIFDIYKDVGYNVDSYPHMIWSTIVKTIQMTIDENLLTQVDQASHSLGVARSAFIRQALELALHESKIADLEQKQITGYQQFPVVTGEFDLWEAEQVWEEK
jgi:hypothetical protein